MSLIGTGSLGNDGFYPKPIKPGEYAFNSAMLKFELQAHEKSPLNIMPKNNLSQDTFQPSVKPQTEQAKPSFGEQIQHGIEKFKSLLQ